MHLDISGGLWTVNLRLALAFGSLAEAIQFGAQELTHLLAERGSRTFTWLPMLVMQRGLGLWPLFWYYSLLSRLFRC